MIFLYATYAAPTPITADNVTDELQRAADLLGAADASEPLQGAAFADEAYRAPARRILNRVHDWRVANGIPSHLAAHLISKRVHAATVTP